MQGPISFSSHSQYPFMQHKGNQCLDTGYCFIKLKELIIEIYFTCEITGSPLQLMLLYKLSKNCQLF